MGCAASKLDNEDAVRRCKERRCLMKDAVYARHHLAAAHSDYCRSLRLTGSALSSFAAGEPLSVSSHTPAVLLHSLPRSTTTNTTPHPPPPPPHFSPPPSSHHIDIPRNQDRPTKTSCYSRPESPDTISQLPHILSASGNAAVINPHRRRHRKQQPIKLPHILSESSPSRSSLRSHSHAPNTYSTTASQTSSAWNWENHRPPSPPDSEFFRRRRGNNDQNAPSTFSNNENPFHKHHPENDDDDDKTSTYSNYGNHRHQKRQIDDDYDVTSSYSTSTSRSQNHIRNHNEEETEREEVRYSEWEDRYSTTSSTSEGERDGEMGARSNFGSSFRAEAAPPPRAPAPVKVSADESRGAGSSGRWSGDGDGGGGMTIVVRHRDLAEIVDAIKEYFDKAASAGERVSEMLETGRAQLDRSFSQLKSTERNGSWNFPGEGSPVPVACLNPDLHAS